MATSDGLTNSPSSVEDADPTLEYYEEVDDHILDFRKKRKAPAREPTETVDPLKQLNKQLNRQFRPDLALPTPSPPPISSELPAILPIVERAPSPNPIVYDARAKPAKPVKSPKQQKEPSISVKQKLVSRIHQLTAPSTESIPYTSEIFQQQTPMDGSEIPSGMILVPASHYQPQQQTPMRTMPSQQQNPVRTIPSQQQRPPPVVSQYKPPTVTYTNSFKNNKVAPPPPPIYNTQSINPSWAHNSYQRPSLTSTNPLIQSTYISQHKAFKLPDQLKTNQKKSKKQSKANPTDTNRSFALYNQQNGRIEGIVKNRLNVATDNTEESRIVDEETKPKGKWVLWLSQPLCLGLKRLSGGLLFGTMILLGTASFAGLIASIVTYAQDNVTNAQWKILGMVVCAIMLITIIVTLLVFICCYKYGYMFNKDANIDPNDPSTGLDAEGNERQKAVLRKIYKFNRPNDASTTPSRMIQDVPTPAPIHQQTVQINDKQTNTETTIAPVRPKDFDRGVWPSINAYGGISYRPLIPPQTVSRFIQVLPHEIEETYQPQQIIYQLVAPPTVAPPRQVQQRIIQIPAPQAPVVEVIETKSRQPRTTVIRQPQTRIEYVDVEEQRPRQIIQQPQYRYVEEVIERSSSEEEEEEEENEIVEIVDAPRYLRQHGRKKEKKQGFRKVSVKHVRSVLE